MGFFTKLAEKFYNNYAENHAEWWGNIQAKADIINTRAGITRAIVKMDFDDIAQKLANDPGFNAFVKTFVNEGHTKEFQEGLEEWTEEVGKTFDIERQNTIRRDKKRLLEFEALNLTSDDGDKYCKMMGEAYIVWTRAGKPYCRMFDGYTECKKIYEDNIYE
jgi:hypothetical protein